MSDHPHYKHWPREKQVEWFAKLLAASAIEEWDLDEGVVVTPNSSLGGDGVNFLWHEYRDRAERIVKFLEGEKNAVD